MLQLTGPRDKSAVYRVRMKKRGFKNRCDVATRLLSVLIASQQLFKKVQFQSLSLNSYNPVFVRLTLITRYILLFLKSFRYCINVIKYMHVIYIILEIFSQFLKKTLRLSNISGHYIIASKQVKSNFLKIRGYATDTEKG